MDASALHHAISTVPPGKWAVGVSGGADSVALLLLLRDRPDLSLHVLHLDHETRNGQSAVDARFVVDLSANLKLPCTVGRRSEIELDSTDLAKNLSDRYRRARLAFFGRLVAKNQLDGILLAHQADDQAETVLLRIMRGSGIEHLRPIKFESNINGLRILRPLLSIPAEQLKQFLNERSQPWREDASNQSSEYQRNRLRKFLAGNAPLRDVLIHLGKQSDQLRDWLDQNASPVPEQFPIQLLIDAPAPLARHAAARWLLDRGSPPRLINPKTCNLLIAMCTDAASPPRQHFPGGLLVRRRRGLVFVDRSAFHCTA